MQHGSIALYCTVLYFCIREILLWTVLCRREVLSWTVLYCTCEEVKYCPVFYHSVTIHKGSIALSCTIFYWCSREVLPCTVLCRTGASWKYCLVLYCIKLIHQGIIARYCTILYFWIKEVMCLYPDERREAQENTSMRSWEFPRKLPGLNADNFLFSLTQAKVQTFPISEFYVALAIPIAIAV